MRRLAVATCTVALLVGEAGCGEEERPAPGTACGDVAFAPRTDDGAFSVRAYGTDCATALAIARATRDRRVTDPLAFVAAGFRCTGTRTPTDALPGVEWRCERGDRLVTFTRN